MDANLATTDDFPIYLMQCLCSEFEDVEENRVTEALKKRVSMR